MKYFSMFAGIGGFEVGLENSKYDFECVGYSEVDKYAESIYRRHFPDHKGYGDATKINTEELPDFELLVGGFPCQAFSYAGKRRGFDDTRGTLFFELARVLKHKRPRYFLFENVKGLLSHNQGETFQTILEILSNMGYNVTWEILNSKSFGVPQNRERIFIKGYLRDKCGQEVFRPSRVRSEDIRKVSEVNQNKIQRLVKAPQSQRILSQYGVSSTLCSTLGGQGAATGLYYIADEGKDIYKDEKPVVRKLTPTETETLQGFPKNWTKYGEDGEQIADQQRYKCCGNAVTTIVVTYVINNMFEEELQ